MTHMIRHMQLIKLNNEGIIYGSSEKHSDIAMKAITKLNTPL